MDLVFPAWTPETATLLDAIPAVAAQGVTWVEWGLGNAGYFDEGDARVVEAVRTALAQTGISPMALHAAFGEDLDLASFDPSVREAAFEAARRAVLTAQQVGARYVVVHAGHGPSGERWADRLQLAREGVCALEPLARGAGVTLALENLPPGYLGCDAEALLDLLDAIDSPYLGICFDTGHAYLTGDFLGLARRLLPRTVTMHVHDNDGSGDQHLLPGLGRIPWAEFARLYEEAACRAPGTLECPPPEGWAWNQCATAVRRLLGW